MAQLNATGIRLSTSGKADVKRDFTEVRQAGETAFKGIADRAVATGAEIDKQLKRQTAIYERAVADREAADRRAAAAASKMSAIVPRTAMQETVDRSAGLGGARLSQTGTYDAQGKSARESSAALRELLALEDAQQAKVAAIKAAIDPLAVAQARYSSAMRETIALRRADNLTADEARQYQVLLKQQLDQSTAAHVQAGTGMRAHRAGMQQLGFQASDFFVQISSGTDAIRAFSLQAPQAVQAIALMGDGAEKSGSKFASFANFLSTGWGAAILIGVSAIGSLATAMLSSGDEAEKAKPKHRSLDEVLRDQKASVNELTEATKDYERQQKKATEVTIQSLAVKAQDIAKDLQRAIAVRQNLAAELELYQAIARRGAMSEANDRLRTDAMRRVNELGAKDGEIAENKARIAGLMMQAKYIVPEVATEVARLQTDTQAQTKAGFDVLRNQARETIKDVTALTARLAELNRQEQAALEALQQTQRESRRRDPLEGRTTAIFGMPVDGGRITGQWNEQRTGRRHGGVDIAVPVGTPVRAVADGVVTFAGMRGNYGNLLEIDTGGAVNRAGHLSRFAVSAGDQVKKGDIIGYSGGARGAPGAGNSQGPHLHWETRVNGRPVNPFGRYEVNAGNVEDRAAKLEERAQRDAERAEQRKLDFAQAREALDMQELQLRQAGITNIDEIAKLERERVALEEKKYKLAVEEKFGAGSDEAKELSARRAKLSELENQAIDQRRTRALAQEALEQQISTHDREREILELKAGLARTAAERRTIALRILDLDHQDERATLEGLAADTSLSDAKRQAARDALKRLSMVYGLREQGELQRTAGPLEDYVTNLDQSRDDIYQRVQAFAVDELEWFRKGLGDAVSDLIGVRDPLLTQLIDMFIEQVIIRPIAEALERSAAGGGGGILGQLFNTVANVAMSAIGGPGGAVSTANIGASAAIKFLGKNALGTEHFSGGLTWLAENGPEIVHLPAGSKVTPAAETRRLLGTANDNARPVMHQSFDLRGAVMTEELLAEMDRRSQAAAETATQSGIAALLDQNRRSYGALFASGRGD